MPKYLSGRQKLRPSDKLTEDRYQYLGLDQAEPNLADPLTSPGVPGGTQYQLVAVAGYDGRRYWVPVGGAVIPGAITVFDENNPVSSASSITQLNFVGAAVTANVSVQSPSGHPGIAATVTVIPVNVGDNPPNIPTPNEGELWWESDTGDLYIYYNDGDSSQWVMANSGGRGLTGDKGEVGPKGEKGQKGELGNTGSQGDKGEKGAPSTVAGDKGQKGEIGATGSGGSAGSDGDKGQKGEVGATGTGTGTADKIFENNTSVECVDTGTGVVEVKVDGTETITVKQGEVGINVSDPKATLDVARTSDNYPAINVSGGNNTYGDLTVESGEILQTGHWNRSTSTFTERFRIGTQGALGIAGSNYGSSGQVLSSQGSSASPQWVDAQNVSGLKGQKGEVGATGSGGAGGDKGQKGEVGSQGSGGSAGSDGSKGQKGEVGAAGSAGNSNSTQVIRSFTSNTTYSPTSGTKNITVYCIAGGGGSGRADGDDSGEQSDYDASGGGGGGGACIGYYNLTGSFSASIQIGGGGVGGTTSGQPRGGGTGGESRFTPSGSYSGNGTLDANGGGASGQGAGPGGGGGASGGLALTGDSGQRMATSSSGGQYYNTPGKGGLAGYNFGTYGRGGYGTGPSGSTQAGNAGGAGIVVIYEYIV